MKKIFSLIFAAILVSGSYAAHMPKMGKAFVRNDARIAQLINVPSDIDFKRPMRAPQATQSDMSSTFTDISCQYYSNSAYSQAGSYDYYFTLFAGYDYNGYKDYPIIVFDLYLPTNTGLVDGTYTTGAGQLDNVYVFLDEYDYDFAYYGYDEYMSFVVASASVTIQTVSEGVYNLSFTFTSTEGEVITITKTNVALTVPENTYDPSTSTGGSTGGSTSTDADYSYEPTTASTVTVDMDAADIDQSYYKQYGDVDIYLYKIENGDTTSYAALYFYVSGIDATIGIPAGTYSINSTGNVGTVEASSGLQYSSYYYRYYPTPAYFAYLDSDGYISSLYYLVSGSVTVNKNSDNTLGLQLNATSGNGSTIHINYNVENNAQQGDAIDNVNADNAVRKVVEDGMVYFIKNGVRYNALGAVVE